MTAPVLLIEQLDEATTLLTLNRPERRNALSLELMGALCGAFDQLANEPQRRVVILRGAGPAFCSGLDLQESADPRIAEQSAKSVARTFQTLSQCPLITIAAAHGAAFAGGAGLLACCDFAIGSDDLRVSFPEVRRGLIPALVAAMMLDRFADSDLRELFFVAEPISAERALSMRLLHRVVPAEHLLDEARALAATILQGAPQAIRETKRLLRELRGQSPSQRLTLALEAHQHAREGREVQEGIAAFLERRAPNWTTPTH